MPDPKFEHVLVVGAGQMGGGIAQVVAASGRRVSLYDAAPGATERGLAAMRTSLEKLAAKGGADPEETLARVTVVDDLVPADLLIEAVVEDAAVKEDLFRRADDVFPEQGILASNTSSIPITRLGAATRRPDRVGGMHFFNPVHKMKLVEIVRALETSAETISVMEQVAQQMGKETVLIKESPGFITSRINALIGNEAFYMLQEGIASARDIDKALKLGLNHPMGPFELVDLVGLDTRLSILQYLHRTLGEKFRPSPLLEQHVKAGRLGRKAGKGVYDY
jgi:3-hydroxybutyryl-CoA dehydrogenase